MKKSETLKETEKTDYSRERKISETIIPNLGGGLQEEENVYVPNILTTKIHPMRV